MTVEEFKALPVGTIVKMEYEDPDGGGYKVDLGEIVAMGPLEAVIIWPDQHLKVWVGFEKSWVEFISWMEVE